VNARRLAAFALAIVLVVGAYVLRNNVIDGDDSGPTTSPTQPAGDIAAVVCITELAAACDAIAAASDDDADIDVDVTVEPAGATLDRLAATADGELGAAPVWVTIEPYPAMVDAIRQSRRAQPLAAESIVVGASRLAIAFPAATGTDAGPVATLAEFCGGPPTWRCVGANAGSRWTDLGGPAAWGTLRPSLGDAAESALGLASLANAVAGYLGDIDVTRSRWEADTSFITWLRPLANVSESVAQSGGTPLRTMATRPSALDAAATAEFELADLGSAAERLDVNYPEPQMWVQAVVAIPPAGAAPDELVPLVTEALTGQGWTPAGEAGEPLPSAATMLALRALWNDAT